MLEVADVFRRYGEAYVQRFGKQMLPSQRRAFDDILHCRTAAMGRHLYACDRCGHQQYAYHSCKNRSCPKCQGGDAELWLGQRRQELLAVAYFHLVFTLPEELRPIVRRHQKTMYGLLMRAAAGSLMKLAADPRYVGGRIGILAVLHTWTGTLSYHPNAACCAGSNWSQARSQFLPPRSKSHHCSQKARLTNLSTTAGGAPVAVKGRWCWWRPSADKSEHRRDPHPIPQRD